VRTAINKKVKGDRMRITEGQLRRLIRESLIREGERSRSEMMAAVDTQIDFPDLPPRKNAGHFSFKSYDERRKGGRTAAERDLKRIWNEHADHKFFDQDLVKLHGIGLYAHGDIIPAELCIKFLKSHLNKVNRDDISVMGWRKAALVRGWNKNPEPPFGAFISGRVTYAAASDQSTEWTSRASSAARERHASSGLPKRPFYTKKERIAKDIILDEEDWIERIENQGQIVDHELIVSNWKIEALVINSLSWAGRAGSDASGTFQSAIDPILEFCKANNLLVVNEAGETI
jgi:hypothetical protein